MRNHYVSVIVDGKLDAWTGPNPEHDKTIQRTALARAEFLRKEGHTAYAVEIIEIKPEDVEKKAKT